MPVAVLIDVLTVHVFENQIGLSSGGDAGVEEFGDVGVGEPAENPAFAFETLFRPASGEPDAQELDRSLSLKAPIATLREPDGAHATRTDRRTSV